MFLCENPGDQFHTRLRFSNRKSSGAVNIALEAQAQNNSIQTTLNWGNSSTVTLQRETRRRRPLHTVNSKESE